MMERAALEEWVKGLNEDKFRKVILLPLFKALGFHNVVLYHGGPRELGKDFTMWKEEGVKQRINYGVVVKVGIINAKVSGRYSYTEIATQVRQAFGSAFKDESTLMDEKIDRCIVVVNNPIPKDTIEAIRADFAEEFSKNILSIYSFNNLIDDIIIFKIGQDPLNSILSTIKANDPQNAIKGISYFNDGNRDIVSITFQDDLPSEYLQGGLSLLIPNDEEGERFKKDYMEFLGGGKSISIPKKYIKSISRPKVFEYLYPEGEITEVHFERPDIIREVELDIAIEKGDHSFVLNNMKFVARLITPRNVVFESNGALPFSLLLEVNLDDKLNFTYHLHEDASKYNVAIINKYFQFIRAISEGGNLVVKDSASQLKVINCKVEPNSIPKPSELLLDLYNKATFIQNITNVPIFFPSGGLSRDDISDILELHNIIKFGYQKGFSGVFTIELASKDAMTEFPESTEKQNVNFIVTLNNDFMMLGHRYEIGESRFFIKRAMIKYIDVTKDKCSIVITVDKEDDAQVIYRKYFQTETNKDQDLMLLPSEFESSSTQE